MADEHGGDEVEIRRLLGSAERPRSLNEDELVRLRGKIEGLAAPSSPAHAADHVDLPAPPTGVSSSPLRTRVIALVAVAAIVVVGLIVFRPGEDENDIQVGDNPEALIQTPLEQACTREIARLATAIDAWDGIGNWALTQNGEPALDTLAAEALLALARIEGLESGAAEALGELDEGLAAAAELLQAQARSERTAAVTGATRAILDLVPTHPAGAGCELSRLAAWVED